MKTRKVVISCAVTGAVHTPSMSPHLPITTTEIADAAIGAVQAGAAIIHLHARDPVTGMPDQSPERFEPILHAIREACDCIVNITTGGAPTMSLDERLKPAHHFEPELVSLNMGSMNFGLYPALERFHTFQHAWERPYIEGSRVRVFRNTFSDIEYILRTCGEKGSRFEFECYDVGHLYTLLHFLERGLVTGPLLIQTVFGVLGGIGAHPDDVLTMKRTADRLFGDKYVWSVLGVGRHQLPIAAMAASMGGNVRVGLEDSLWLRPGKLAKSNAEQVSACRQAIEAIGLDVASPSEARELLALKGSDQVQF